MSNTLEVVCYEPTQGHTVISKTVWPFVKNHLMAGRRMVISVKPEKRSSAQNKRYWGRGVLAQIAEQATVGGKKFTPEIWHELFKRKFLGVEELPDGQFIGKSSTGLTKAEFSDFCTQVEAYATQELGVMFVDLEQA